MGFGILLPPVHAEFPDVSVFADAVEVDDSELAEMRGKFVSPGQITYFGVEMVTQWQTGSGEVLSAGMKMDMNLPSEGNTSPTVNLIPAVAIEANSTTSSKSSQTTLPTPTELPTATISSTGLNNISGVVQSIQVGGNESQVTNTIEMDVAISTGPVNENTAPQALDINPFSVQKTTDGGSVALAGASQNGIQVYTYVPNQGEILQRISGSPDGGGHIMQSVRLIGNQHRVINTMTISASFNAISSSTINFNSPIQFDLRGFY